jgi:fructuronate reductase
MDGTQKLPQRLVEPAIIALKRGLPLDAYAFAVAAWMRYALGTKESGEKYALRDPREAEIARLVHGVSDAESIMERLLSLAGLFPEELSGSDKWRSALTGRLDTMLAKGMHAAIEEEAVRTRAA